MKKDKLTLKQRKFIEAWQGNGADACRQAGYKGTDVALGVMAHKLLKNAKILKLIESKENKVLKPLIATREDRMKFLSEVMADGKVAMKDRLKATELLGKANGDYIERVETLHSFFEEDKIEDDEINESLK